MSEAQIQNQITDYLTLKNVFWWRMPVQPLRQGSKFKANPIKGFPDLAGIVPRSDGKFFVIEVKTAKGYLSKEQKIWLAKFDKMGVKTLVARSLDDVIEAIDLWTVSPA